MLFSSFAALFIASSALAVPVPGWKREVPQEHAHEDILRTVRPILNLNNPDRIQDVVFGLLGATAAATGAGNIRDADCLQQATADQAFTNAKAAGNVAGMTAALQYRALERNTGAVGQASVQCTSITAKNPEIAAIKQHQDPASNGAAAINKAIVLELAKQIKSIGGNPLDALKTGTFAPGTIGDPTAKGNSCDDANDAAGCINTLNLLVKDATEAEINAAVGGGGAAVAPPVANPPSASATQTQSAPVDCPTAVTVTVAAPAAQTPVVAPPASSAAAPVASQPATATGGNLQKFTGALGGISAPAVNTGGRGFVVANSSDFLNLPAALGRSCDIQHNQCADKSNSGGQTFNVGACDQQNNQCHALIQ